jgi:hypothetical protein
MVVESVIGRDSRISLTVRCCSCDRKPKLRCIVLVRAVQHSPSCISFRPVTQLVIRNLPKRHPGSKDMWYDTIGAFLMMG